MKEEMARMKVLVQQTRNQCAVEVRKRERVVEGLKKHVGDGRVRGGGKNVGVREITVVAGVGGESAVNGGLSTQDEGYDLRSETNEFLTELARGLSEENENLAALVRRTVDTLRTLSGWEKEVHEDRMVIPVELGYENIASEMDAVIEHVRTLLTNPSFVPLEEVEVREEEIIRLREGWERMESRWREAVQMMDGWRKRMAKSGQTVNLEELDLGLMLSPLKEKNEDGPNPHLSTLMEEGEDKDDTQADIDAMEEEEMAEEMEPDFDDDMDSESSLFEDEPLEEQEEEASEQQEEEAEDEDEGFTLNTESSTSIGPPPQLSPLREINGNRARAPSPPPREHEGFSTIIEENTYDFLQLENLSPPKTVKSAKSTPRTVTPQEKPSTHHKQQRSATKLSTPSEDELSLSLLKPTPKPHNRERSVSPRKVTRPTPKAAVTPRLKIGSESRLPRPRDNALPQQSPLTMATIAAKLAASEREADAARVRAKLKAARAGRGAGVNAGGNVNKGSTSSTEGEQSNKDKKLMPPPQIRLVPSEDQELGMSPERREESKKWEVNNGGESERERERERERVRGGKQESPVKSRKRKATGRPQGGRDKASRRRSTLSPWELESLMLVGVGADSPGKEGR
jgi:hypothetical protein